jgi:adenosylmethionine-8-amino-7-oxononanoate aminotransferase
MEKPGFLEGIAQKSQMLEEFLGALVAHPHVAEVRLRGMMGGVELIRDKKKNIPYGYAEKMGYQVCTEAKKQGVLLRPLGNVMVIMPPLAISKKDLSYLMEVISHSIDRVTGK